MKSLIGSHHLFFITKYIIEWNVLFVPVKMRWHENSFVEIITPECVHLLVCTGSIQQYVWVGLNSLAPGKLNGILDM